MTPRQLIPNKTVVARQLFSTIHSKMNREWHSNRFKNINNPSPSSTSFTRNAPTTSLQKVTDDDVHIPQPNISQITTDKSLEDQTNKNTFWLWPCLSSLYARAKSLAQKVSRSPVTCEHAHASDKDNKIDNKTDTKGVHDVSNVCPESEEPVKEISPTLFSSDSEGDSLDSSREFPPEINALADEEFPIIRLIDNVIYFYHLYRINYAAFIQELRTSITNWTVLESEGAKDEDGLYGHNINPKEKRPGFVRKGIYFIKKRKLTNMTRVVGDAHRKWILKIAIISRVFIFFLQLVAINLPKFFRHHNDGFKFVNEKDYGKLLDPFVNSTFGGYVNWDAHYFLHISVYGYTSENILAFFPLLPMCLYIPSRVLFMIFGTIISMSSIVVILGVIFNIWLFVKCTENIYDLAKLWTGNCRELITTACMLFCFNPASIFFNGLYTETLFAYLTSSVIVSLFTRHYLKAILYAAFSGLCRSNGVLNIGLIVAFLFQREYSKTRGAVRYVVIVVRSVIIVSLSAIPFLFFQMYCIREFCQENRLYETHSIPLYCWFNLGRNHPNSWTLPYAYIQKKYWDVGFLRYFQWKQIPNFLLAAPVLITLGTESWASLRFAFSDVVKKGKDTSDKIYECFQALHGLFLTVFCFLFVHVQVSTRMIMSACPYLFIYMADTNLVEIEKFRSRVISLPTRSLMILLWCFTYYFIGTIGFSLGLPWT